MNAVVNAIVSLSLKIRARNTSHTGSVLLLTSTPLADTTGDSRAGSPPAGAVDGAGPKTTLGETRPDLASVGTAGESAVGVEDGVAGLDEVRVAGLPGGRIVSPLILMGEYACPRRVLTEPCPP